MWKRIWKWADWGSRLHFLWLAGMWIYTHALVFAGGGAVIAIIWGFLATIRPLYIALAGLIAFGAILWIINGMGAWIERRKRIFPISGRVKASSPLSYEEIATQTAFIQALQAVAERLNQNTNTTDSVYAILQNLYQQELEFRDEIGKRILVKQDKRFLESRFNNLSDQTSEFNKEVDKLSPSVNIIDYCGKTRRLVDDYKQSVTEFLEFLDGLQQEGIKPTWCSSQWSERIDKKLPKDYNRLMELMKSLREHTPKPYISALPDEDQLADLSLKNAKQI